MPSPEAALAEAVRHIREIALREAMAMCNQLQGGLADNGGHSNEEFNAAAFRRGHKHARMQIYAELERMIAREAPAATVQPGYTSDGLEDGE